MIDFEKIKAIYKFGRNISLSDVQSLLQAAKKRSFFPTEYLIREGEIRKDVFFIRSGLVRGFRINQKGDEITTLLRWENQVVASPDIILFDQPSQSYFEALEPTEVFSLDYDVLQSIVSKNPKLEANRKFVLQEMLKQTLRRIDSFVLLSPEERYVEFVRSNPDIVNRAPNKYIANILGITPVSLSRIRKRIASKKK
jgi:CRP-like cAMP-binding protein